MDSKQNVSNGIIFHTDCIKNIKQKWYTKEAVEERDAIFRFYHGFLAIPITILGLVFTILYIIAVTKAIKHHKVSQKFYSLLLNRAVGDLIGCVVAVYIILYVTLAVHVSSNFTQILNTLFIGCIWSAMVSYVALGFLKLYGIAKPLHYRNQVTMKRCVQLIASSWITFAILVIVTMIVTAFVRIDALSKWSGCKIETCGFMMYSIRNTATVIAYFITISCFIFTVILIKRAQIFASQFHNQTKFHTNSKPMKMKNRFRFPLIKLVLNVATFAIFHLPYTIQSGFLIFTNGCFFLLHYNKMEKIIAYTRICMLIRIVLDALISFGTDRELRKILFEILHIKWKVFPEDSRKLQSFVSVGEISSLSKKNNINHLSYNSNGNNNDSM